MKKIMMIMVLGALIACLVPAAAVEFGTKNDKVGFGAQEPSVSFQSTSNMSMSGSMYSANPSLNEDGTANYGGAQDGMGPNRVSGPRRLGNFDNVPEGGTQENSSPIGDAVMPLTIMALAFCGYVVIRRRKTRA